MRFAVCHREHFEVMFRLDMLHPEDERFVVASEVAYALLTSTIEQCRLERLGGREPELIAVSAWSLRARPRRSPLATAGAGRWVRGCASRRHAGLTPRRAIASPTGRQTISEPPDVVARAAMRAADRLHPDRGGLDPLESGVVGLEDPAIARVDGTIILALVGLIALLWSRWPIPLTSLQALELGAVGLLAGRVAFVEYRLMLRFSQRGDMMTAPMVLKNVVLLTAVLILTYGLYVPKTWRRAALVVGPLALLPFATLSVLALQHPAAMAWLWEGAR